MTTAAQDYLAISVSEIAVERSFCNRRDIIDLQ